VLRENKTSIDELFVVLLLKGEVLENCEALQKEIAEHYNLYAGDIYPELHITLNRIYKENVNGAVAILKKIGKKFNKIKIELESFSCYRQYNGVFLVLKVKESESLRLLANELHERFKRAGITTVENYKKCEFHITILSNLFAKNPIKHSDFESLCFFIEGYKYRATSYSDIIQIWSPVNDPDNKNLFSFTLGN